MEKDLVKFFGAGLTTVGSAVLNLTIPAGCIQTGTVLIEEIAAGGKTKHIESALFGTAAILKLEIENHGFTSDDIAHHARSLVELIDADPPEPDDIRAAIHINGNGNGNAAGPSLNGEKPTADSLADALVSTAEDIGSIDELELNPDLSVRMLKTLFAHLLNSPGEISALRDCFITFLSDAQVTYGLNALERGRVNGDMKELKRAVEALELAQHIQTENMVPENWAKLQNDKGAALGIIGEQTSDPIKLRQAIDVLTTAADVLKKDDHPDLWVETQVNLGNAGWVLGLMEDNPDLLRQSFRRLEKAHGLCSASNAYQRADLIHSNLEHMLVMIKDEKNTV